LEELGICFDTVDVADEGDGADEELGSLVSMLDAKCIGIDSVGRDGFVSAIDVEGWER